jgi:DNA-binding transcriptional ArsR family regulator
MQISTFRLLTLKKSDLEIPMPDRRVAATELAEIFRITAHPDRIRLIEELRTEEKDVKTLSDRLELPGSRVSQHLGLMKAHRIVEERREGRHHYYRLSQPEIANWIIEGLLFVEGRLNGISKSAISTARELWSTEPDKESN